MWVDTLRIKNVKAFADTGTIQLSKSINLLVAKNNSGKSTILRCLYNMQENDTSSSLQQMARLQGGPPSVDIHLSEITEQVVGLLAQGSQARPAPTHLIHADEEKSATISFSAGRVQLQNSQGKQIDFPKFRASEAPQADRLDHWIYPYLSRRKEASYVERLSKPHCQEVKEIPHHLYSKVDDLIGRGPEFAALSKDILGFRIGSSLVGDGKVAGIVVQDNVIRLSEMGDGTRQALQLIRDLHLGRGKLFLLEEPENDLHPQVLKKLLSLIAQRAEDSQFVISTHSNIVLKYLGSIPRTNVITISTCFTDNSLPVSEVKRVDDSPEMRIELLRDMGYELLDFDLWEGYLLLEESSAERIINELLIPEFAPRLKHRLRTISCNGASKVEACFEDFARLFVFIHTTEAYFERAWVLIDGGIGENVVAELRRSFKTWSPDHFQCLKEHDFEAYYPASFRDRADQALKTEDKAKRRIAKREVLTQVLCWIEQDRAAAKLAFQDSAREVIQFLQQIEHTLVPGPGNAPYRPHLDAPKE